MCNHIWNETIKKIYFDKNTLCRTEIRVRSCIFCGKQVKELIRVKDPPKRRLPKFIKHDLSDI